MSAEPSTTQPLSRLASGRKARVAALAGGCELQYRLVSMGLNVGCEVEVLRGSRNGFGGPTLVALGNTRLAIGRGMAERILVTPLEAGDPAPAAEAGRARRATEP